MVKITYNIANHHAIPQCIFSVCSSKNRKLLKVFEPNSYNLSNDIYLLDYVNYTGVRLSFCSIKRGARNVIRYSIWPISCVK